jgi:CheY-like chemotaxis protein
MRTLLLADDSLTVRRVIELTFAEEPEIQVVAVSGGDEAIAWLDAHPVDVVLADVDMPGASGYAVAEHVRDSPRLAHVPVVLLTGAADPLDRERVAATGCRAVLVKPFAPDVVIDRVNALLRGDAAAMETPDAPRPAEPPKTPESYFVDLDARFAALSGGGDTAAEAASPLLQAFASLLDAERRGQPRTTVEWPSALRRRPAPVTEEFVEQVVQRVLERLPERVLRQAIADHVSAVAERLVQEEIDRIKSFMK